jgi:hypothetical protein
LESLAGRDLPPKSGVIKLKCVLNKRLLVPSALRWMVGCSSEMASLNNQRRAIATGPYLLLDGTLDECIREFMAKPAPQRHLYEIHAAPQPPLVADVLSGEIVAELAQLRDFL